MTSEKPPEENTTLQTSLEGCHLQAAAAEKQKEAARELLKRAPAKKLAGTLLKGGYQVGRPQLSVGRSLLPPCLQMQPSAWLHARPSSCNYCVILQNKGGNAGAHAGVRISAAPHRRDLTPDMYHSGATCRHQEALCGRCWGGALAHAICVPGDDADGCRGGQL